MKRSGVTTLILNPAHRVSNDSRLSKYSDVQKAHRLTNGYCRPTSFVQSLGVSDDA